MEVELRFARVNPWAGIAKYKNCYDYIGPYFTRSGNIYTGLTEEDARRLEKAIGFEEGKLSPSSLYWKTYSVRLGAKPLYLHTERPEDELAYLFLKNHKRVALGLSNLRPQHDYVLVNSNAEAEAANRLNKVKREAFAEFNKMSLEDMRKCLRIYGHKADNISNELVESKLFELIEKDPNKYFLIWVNNKNKETQYILETAISKNIIRKSKNVYYYGTDVIGRSQDDAISFLNDKSQQEIKLAILSEIEGK
ncbi:MAG: hypothetical protein J6A25_05725 [Lachnospiraceae bacterium]|nr:hypothetical protein [Lachnospiraceae bacterium]